MNWLEKINYLIEKKYKRRREKDVNDTFFYDVAPEVNAWTTGELEKLAADYPWLPKTYLEFIAKHDGISIAFCRFYGSEKGDAITLKEIFELQGHLCLVKGYFPFGCDPGGSNYIFNKQGKVYLWHKYDYDFEEEPKLIADSLESFVEDCLMGKRYVEFNKVEKDNYYQFLKSEGWV